MSLNADVCVYMHIQHAFAHVCICSSVCYSLKHMLLIGDVNKHAAPVGECVVLGHSFPYGEPNTNMSLLVYCDTAIISHIQCDTKTSVTSTVTLIPLGNE